MLKGGIKSLISPLFSFFPSGRIVDVCKVLRPYYVKFMASAVINVR